jgi:hypothetical protein
MSVVRMPRKKHYFSFILTTDATDHSSMSNVHKS